MCFNLFFFYRTVQVRPVSQSVQERQHSEGAFDVRLRRCQVAQLSLVPVQLQAEIQSQKTPERTAQSQLVTSGIRY